MSPGSPGEVETVSPSVQGSHLSLNRYPLRPLPCTEHSTCTRPHHSTFLSFTCPSPVHPFTQVAPGLNSQDVPVCSSLALEPSLPCSIISFMLARSLPLDSYLQERKKKARSVCIPTVPEPVPRGENSTFLSVLPCYGLHPTRGGAKETLAFHSRRLSGLPSSRATKTP